MCSQRHPETGLEPDTLMRLSGRIWVHRPEQKRVSCTTGRDVYTGPG